MKLQERIRLAVGSDDRIVLWRNQSGQYNAAGLTAPLIRAAVDALKRGHVTVALRILEESAKERWVRYGVGKGGSDLIGLNSQGRFVALEVKEGRDRLSDDQRSFLNLVSSKGGYACEVRSEQDAQRAVVESMLDLQSKPV